METKKYQAVVVGAGPGGYPCAIRLAQLGVKTLCVEREFWGGVCLNVGCIPSKALITAGKRLQDIHTAATMGIQVSGEATLDVAAMMAWKNGIVKRLTGGVQKLLEGNGVDRLMGTARLVGPGVLEVMNDEGTTRVEAAHIVLATGSRPVEIPGFAFSDPRVLDSTKALDISEVPHRAVVIGGGYIGLECGQMLNKLGCEVTVVEMMDSILPGFDREVLQVVARKMKKSGIHTLLHTRAQGWAERDGRLVVEVHGDGGKTELVCDKVIVTVGRKPYTEGLDPAAAGVTVSQRGFIEVDEQLRTNVPNILAVGDVTGNPMLAHRATKQGEVAAEVVAGKNVAADYKTVPAVVFTDPEIATAGLSEAEARDQGFEVKVGKFPWAANGRALTQGETDGFVKVITDAGDGQILGVAIVGPSASDLISEAALAIEMDAFAEDVGLTIHPHPTLGEAVMEAANKALGHAIHVMN